MSPEQARGDAVDHRSDLFSLGSVLYTLCTGETPFRGSTAVEVLKEVCDQMPRPIRELNSDVPEWLCAIIERLHAKLPAERFQSASELAEELTRLPRWRGWQGPRRRHGPGRSRPGLRAVEEDTGVRRVAQGYGTGEVV